MTRFVRLMSTVILLALVFTIGIAAAAGYEETHADLNVSKTVRSTGPYTTGDEVTWAVSLRNNGPANATNITLKEDISRLGGLLQLTVVADHGVYNSSTNVWSIDRLNNATTATLSIRTNFSSAGTKTNRITITGLNETDPVPGNNQDEAVVQFNASGRNMKDEPVSANLVIRPTTLNLNSKGLFTVYISLTQAGFESAEGSKKPRIDYANSSLTCSGADMVRASVSNKDGGTLIAKFHRYDLENVTPGNGVKINCSGKLKVDDLIVAVEGNDTIRVIDERKGLDKILSRLWKFLGIEKDDIEMNESEDGNVTVMFTLNPDNFKNSGQVKKLLKNQGNASDRENGDETSEIDQSRGGKEKSEKNQGDTTQIRQKTAGDRPERGTNGSKKGDDESFGKSNGKKNT
jgi:uncharacterized repeat protein (TIGR01451 family)